MGTVAKVQETTVDRTGKCLTCLEFFTPPDIIPAVTAHIEANRDHTVKTLMAQESEFAWVE